MANLGDHFSGDGVKFTHSYCSKIPDYKLEEKRNEFWGMWMVRFSF